MDMRRQEAEGNVVKNRKRQRDGGDSSVTGERRHTLTDSLFEMCYSVNSEELNVQSLSSCRKYILNSTNRK